MAASGYQKKTNVIVISAECIYKFVTNLMVFIKRLLIQLFLSFGAEKLINQLFNPNFFYWDKEQQSKAQNSDSKYHQMALNSFDT